eukprot:804734-Heterocapsa_arctica.AAC.1
MDWPTCGVPAQPLPASPGVTARLPSRRSRAAATAQACSSSAPRRSCRSRTRQGCPTSTLDGFPASGWGGAPIARS